jgi:hypothetical protein
MTHPVISSRSSNASPQPMPSKQDDQVAECQIEGRAAAILNRNNNGHDNNNSISSSCNHSHPLLLLLLPSNGDANELSPTAVEATSRGPKTPVLRKLGEKTPPGTLKRSKDRPTSSCKSWCEQYSQTFLAKTIDTPLPQPGPFEEDDFIIVAPEPEQD